MANALYEGGRNAFLSGGIVWTTDTIGVALVDGANYTPNMGSHIYMSDAGIASAGSTAIVASGTLDTATAASGIADAADETFSTVTGDPCEYIILWKATAALSGSNMIALIDTATGLPVTPNGGDITIQWDSGANKIFKL